MTCCCHHDVALHSKQAKPSERPGFHRGLGMLVVVVVEVVVMVVMMVVMVVVVAVVGLRLSSPLPTKSVSRVLSFSADEVKITFQRTCRPLSEAPVN